MIKIKTREEIELMRESALLVSKTLGILAQEVKPGVTTLYLDKLAETFIRDHGAIPGFLGLYDFPKHFVYEPQCSSSAREFPMTNHWKMGTSSLLIVVF
jgi:methionyl aminopeptidase